MLPLVFRVYLLSIFKKPIKADFIIVQYEAVEDIMELNSLFEYAVLILDNSNPRLLFIKWGFNENKAFAIPNHSPKIFPHFFFAS